MKLNEVKSVNYTSYVLPEQVRQQLQVRFPPKYPEFIGHHVTEQFGVAPGTPAPDAPSTANVVGYVDSGDGLEVLVVSINGTSDRPNGGTYHITWSLDRSKYTPKDSNELLAKKRYLILRRIPIQLIPQGT